MATLQSGISIENHTLSNQDVKKDVAVIALMHIFNRFDIRRYEVRLYFACKDVLTCSTRFLLTKRRFSKFL